jgi:hypothetical protein
MRVTIDGKPVDGLTPKIEKSLLLAKRVETTEGTVLTADDAVRAFVGQTRTWYAILGAIGVVLMLAIGIGGAIADPIDGTVVALGAGAMVVLLVFFLWWLLQRRIKTFTASVDRRRVGLPPNGTRVAIDKEALTVGTERLNWPRLAIDLVELSRSSASSGDTSETVHIVERLTLAGATQPITLDRTMISNGLVLTDNVWRNFQDKR